MSYTATDTKILRNTTCNATAITIAWRYLSTQNQICGKNIYYRITVSSHNDTKITTSNYTNCTITDLISGTTYILTVAATDGDIVGNQDTIIVTTKEQQDSPIEGVFQQGH